MKLIRTSAFTYFMNCKNNHSKLDPIHYEKFEVQNTYAASQSITKIKSYYTFYAQDVLMPNLISKNYLKTTKIADLVV